jgi:hypothetical protein
MQSLLFSGMQHASFVQWLPRQAVRFVPMNVSGKADNKAWVGTLRDAIGAGDERLYRQKLMQFLVTREGVSFVEAVLRRPSTLAVMRRSYRALSVPLDLKHPNDLVAWLLEDEATPVVINKDSRAVASMALPYFRFARGWARAAHKDSSYAVALALMFFEPVLQLCEARGTFCAAVGRRQ